ncbi:hypothetical protein AAMO2058_000576500, partial [Amorphochlora amoebiformis]
IRLRARGQEVNTKHMFLVKVYNKRVSVSGDQIVGVEYRNDAKAQLEALTKIMNKTAGKTSQKEDSKPKLNSPRIADGWSLSPFAIGCVAVALLASYETKNIDTTSKMFLSYLIGLIMMAMHNLHTR